MSTQGDESEEIKSLTKHQLACIVWPLRVPKDQASYLEEFAHHIKTKFNEPSASKFSRELSEFSNLRNIAISTLSDNAIRDASSLKALKKYYCQLASMLIRFKDCGAEFTWKDSFGRNSNEGNLEFELNNIMYNIAAVHNEFGSKIAKSNETTTREACQHFNSALWWVTELRDRRTGLKPKEMGHDLLTFFHHVLQAQAQECVLSHSIKAGMKAGSVSMISAQIASDYDVAYKLSQTPVYTDPLREIMTGASIFHTWRATVEFKSKYFSAMTQLLAGLAKRDDDAKEIGFRIARLKMASQLLESCKKVIGDTLDSQLTKATSELLEALVMKKLDRAIKFNDNVYHASIPSREALAQPDAKLLVSPAPFSIASMPEFKDLFSNLVTIESVQVNSIYSQKKDELSRDIKTKVEEHDELLVSMMSTLNIDKRNLRLPPMTTPDELVEIWQELASDPNVVDDVLTKLEDLDEKSSMIQSMLDGIQEMLRKRPNRQLENELKGFKKTHEEALRTTQQLHKQLNPELTKTIQSIATTKDPNELLPKVSTYSREDEEIVSKLEKLLDKVDEMKQQRAVLINQLKQSLENDDVIKHVVAASSEHELKSVFEKEIQKHDKYIGPLGSNLKLQKDVLDMIEDLNARYAQVKMNHLAQQDLRAKKVQPLKTLYEQFKKTTEGVEGGIEYHKKMVGLVRNLYAKVQASSDLNDLLN